MKMLTPFVIILFSMLVALILGPWVLSDLRYLEMVAEIKDDAYLVGLVAIATFCYCQVTK